MERRYLQSVEVVFHYRHNFPHGAEFLFVFSSYFHPRNHKTKKNSAPREKFRLVENGLKGLTGKPKYE
jgi:hypothetical protein